MLTIAFANPSGHTIKLGKPVSRHPDLLMRDGIYIEQRLPKKIIKATVHTRADWSGQSDEIIESDAIALFTDGSRVEGSSSVGYHCLRLQISGSVPLGQNSVSGRGHRDPT